MQSGGARHTTARLGLAVVVAVVVVGLVGACATATSPKAAAGGECILSSVTVTPADTTVSVGDTLHAQAALPACAATQVAQFVWRSSDPGVATVDSLSGLVQALRRGKASIIAIDAREPAVTGAMALQVAP